MWVAKFKLKHKGDIFTARTKKFNINFYAYPLTHYGKNNKFFFVVNGFLDGEDSAKKKFLLDLKKDKRIIKVDEKNDYVTALINYPNTQLVQADMETFYDPSIIHTSPVLNSKEGFEHWSVASFEKENLNKLITSAQTLHNGKLLSMENKKSDELFIVSIKPHISKMQTKIILAAFEHGYYEYPRRIEIAKLAKILKISYSTCQEHLRKAEIALLPSMIKKL